MSLFGIKEKKELNRLRAQISPEQQELFDLSAEIQKAKEQLADIQKAVLKAQSELSTKKQEIIQTDDDLLLQSFGMYEPHYSYALSDDYKSHLKTVRDMQKEAIKAGLAVNGNENWTVNGSSTKGKKMVHDMQKLLLRAFNSECDDAIEHVRFNNIETCEKKINASANAISKLGEMMGISITIRYINLKLEELYLMHEYHLKKQDEKEAAKELRQRQREEAKAAKELAEAKAKLEKEQSHYTNALARLNEQLLKVTTEDEQKDILKKKAELEGQLAKIDVELKDVDYRAANQRAGYVYIISNLGAFGENVYKIGMTRRLDPMDRIDELGDASVPFNFDVHAMIFTDDAPGLEAALHNAFADRKLNFINQRREFFNVTMDEIKNVVRQNYDKTVEFIDVAPAQQYRESLRLRASVANTTIVQ